MSQQNIGIVGLGYVGLPLAVASSKAGHRVFGIDTDNSKIHALEQGKSYIEDITSKTILNLIKSGSFSFGSDFSDIASCSIVIICVPTPLDLNSNPDLTILSNAVKNIAPNLRAGTLVISESTSYPGTLRNFIKPLVLSESNLGENEILFAVAPERVDPGNKSFNHQNTPRVVGALDEQALILASAFYKTITSHVVNVSQPEVAEAAKMLENTFRQVNIALINEFSKIANTMKFDVHETIEAASTKPYGFMKFTPGPGVGGHCIPVDPYYLTWSSRESGFIPEFIEKANDVNRAMPEYVVERFRKIMSERMHDLKVMVAGLAYKPGIADIRESPAIHILKKLKDEGCSPEWYDPIVENYSEFPQASLESNFSGVIITLPGLKLPIQEWLKSGTKILDCTGQYRNFREIEQL